MYIGLLHLHNILRWVVLIAALVVLANALLGLSRGRAFERRDRVLGAVFTGSMDLQLVLGLVLYFVSPLVQGALRDLGATMRSAELRFFAVEHASVMVIAVILAHVGSVLARRAATDRAKFRQQLVWYGLSLLLVLSRIPWGRALLPGV